MSSDDDVYAATQAAAEKAVGDLTDLIAEGHAQFRQMILNAVAMALIPMVTEVNRLKRDLEDAARYIAELEAEDEPQPRPITIVDAAGSRLVHGGHHDDEDAVRMARNYWQLAVEEGEAAIAPLAAIDAGQVIVTRETQDPIAEDDDPDDEAQP